MHGSTETKAGAWIRKGTSSVVSALVTEEEGTVVISCGAGGDSIGYTEVEGAVGVTGKGYSSLSW